MFADTAFIELSRKFVCLRLETYESEENQARVKKYLNGKLANTTFVMLSPDGEKQLTRGSRSPSMSFANRGGSDEQQLKDVLAAMQDILDDYPAKGSSEDALVPDFYSFKQALNVSSADQRLLVFTVAANQYREAARNTLKQVANASELRGKFHYDIAENSDAKWMEGIENVKDQTGYFIIYPGEFGLEGKSLLRLPLNTKVPVLKERLQRLNAYYAANEKPKHYSEHSVKGAKLGINFSNTMPHGEDRDGDGVTDKRGGQGRRRN